MASVALDLRVGDVVEVLSQAEILATLDANGELESMPFMPEMLEYCGKRLTVHKLAHKTCDTLTRTGLKRVENAVHLSGVRCGGGGHGGCQAACSIFWKHAWLRKVDPSEAATSTLGPAAPELLPLLTISSQRPPADDGSIRYRCQATELPRFAPDALPLKDVGQFVQDVRSGNAGLFFTLRGLLVAVYDRVQGVSKRVLPAKLRFRGGRQWGHLQGRAVAKTPVVVTGLQPGDVVRIRSKEEVESTLNAQLLNRGMGFDSEMGRFCGRTGTVVRKVDQIIDEHTGQMIKMKNPCLVLEGVVCEGAFNLNCPREITPYWREAWLEKIDERSPKRTPIRDSVKSS